MHVCDRIRTTAEFSLDTPHSQYNPRSGEFLADPSGHEHLYLVRGSAGWSAYTRKHELPAEAFEVFDPVGLALQLITGDTNGYVTPYRDIVVVPAGMRAKPTGDTVTFGRDDLRDFLKDNWKPAYSWDDDLLAWPDADQTNTTQLLSGGMDSVGCLLSHKLVGRPLPALHIARPGFEHELKFAQQVARENAVSLTIAQCPPVTPEDAFTDLQYSPFGRAFVFAMYNRAMREHLKTPFAIHGELSLIDMQFADHGDRFRHIRRAFFHRDGVIKAFRTLQPFARIFPAAGGTTKLSKLMRSLQSARSKALYLWGTFIGPQGFPGIANAPFIRNEEEFLAQLDRRLSELINDSLEPEDMEIDYFLVAFRFSEGNSNLVGPQEAAASVGKATHHPMNKLNTLLRQATVAPEAGRDKMILKKHFYKKFPGLEEALFFKMNLALGHRPSFFADADWMSLLDSAMKGLPETTYVSNGDLATWLRSQTWGEAHMNVSSMLKRREQALDPSGRSELVAAEV